MANDSLQQAKRVKNDEFYTVYDYIQKEINAFIEYDPDTFRDKVLLCPCDDPEWSNFTKFFAQNFEMLGLKKLISTSYSIESKKMKYEQFRQMTTRRPINKCCYKVIHRPINKCCSTDASFQTRLFLIS